MIKRSITGACLIAVVTAFFFLREVHIAFFTGFIGFLSVLATFEFTRALGERIRPLHKYTAIAFALSVAPLFHFFSILGVTYAFMGFAVLQLLFAVVLNAEIESFAYGVSAMVYPTLFVGSMLILNALPANSTLALLMVFVVSSFADTFAYLVGSLLKGKKLCPTISPNKTVSGAIGGLVGGAVGALVLYFIFKKSFVYAGALPAWVLIMLIGMVCAFLTEVGDLAESVCKRKLGVKDMGKLLPGHGGIMDRIDGMMFSSVFLAFAFTLFI
ncbi:MAG: phosphatidate cytidylyltransferase [Clostridia bacterium]|nr:phosphatidate cytidylyltransferase [Clostridia bacterium]